MLTGRLVGRTPAYVSPNEQDLSIGGVLEAGKHSQKGYDLATARAARAAQKTPFERCCKGQVRGPRSKSPNFW